MLNILSGKSTLADLFMSEIRDREIQKDRMRFRRNLERMGELFAYEISKQLEWEKTIVETPFGKSETLGLKQQPVLGTILRAGLPLHQGLLNCFDRADNAFISAYRAHDDKGSFKIKLEYLSCPSLEGKVLILADPMIATGASVVGALKEIASAGKPAHTHIVCVVTCPEGVKHLTDNLENITIWAGAVDKGLNKDAYIIPGIGDAGDLAFGEKRQR